MRRIILVLLVVIYFTACTGAKVLPEMNEFINAFGDKKKIENVVEKFGGKDIIKISHLTLCDLEKPIIKDRKKVGNTIIYSAESRVKSCPSSETAAGTIRMFKIGWENGRIKTFKWEGPKSGRVEY